MNGKAAFYASIYPDLKEAALKCGWALGLHGSLANDMDIMAMPWTEQSVPVNELMKALSDCFTDNPFKDEHVIPFTEKPNGRVVYTMSIWADWYLDINIINVAKKTPAKKFNSLDIPEIDKTTNNNYSIDVLVLYNEECYVGYYHFPSNEWRYNCSKVNEENTFNISDPDDLQWITIKS